MSVPVVKERTASDFDTDNMCRSANKGASRQDLREVFPLSMTGVEV